jgi:hypothetical protein
MARSVTLAATSQCSLCGGLRGGHINAVVADEAVAAAVLAPQAA